MKKILLKKIYKVCHFFSYFIDSNDLTSSSLKVPPVSASEFYGLMIAPMDENRFDVLLLPPFFLLEEVAETLLFV